MFLHVYTSILIKRESLTLSSSICFSTLWGSLVAGSLNSRLSSQEKVALEEQIWKLENEGVRGTQLGGSPLTEVWGINSVPQVTVGPSRGENLTEAHFLPHRTNWSFSTSREWRRKRREGKAGLQEITPSWFTQGPLAAGNTAATSAVTPAHLCIFRGANSSCSLFTAYKIFCSLYHTATWSGQSGDTSPASIWGFKTEVQNAGEGVEKREPSYTAGGNVNWCSHYGKQCGSLLKNSK